MPTIAVVEGVRIEIYFGDHPPPHLHATYAEHRAMISIATGDILEGSLPPHGGAWVRDRLPRLGIATPSGVVFLVPREPGLPLTGRSLEQALSRSTP